MVETGVAFIDPTSGNVDIDIEKLAEFLQYAKHHCRHWKKSYEDCNTFDGEQWECDIWTDTFRLKSSGSNAYPGNFEFFREKLQWMTDGKMF